MNGPLSVILLIGLNGAAKADRTDPNVSLHVPRVRIGHSKM